MSSVEASGADVADEANLSSTGVAVLDKLQALEIARKNDVKKRREEQAEQADPRESINAFLGAFAEKQKEVESGIAKLLEAGPGNAASINPALDALSTEAFTLEQKTANASYYLPAYDQKRCTNSVAELKASIDTARTTLVPKKKFAFSKKVSRVKGDSMKEGSTAVAAAQATARTVAPIATEHAPATPSDRDVELVKSGRGLMGLRNEVIVWSADKVAGQEVVLIDLQGCTVYLLGQMPNLRMLGIKNSRIITGPVTGPCFVDDAADSTFYLASYQVRIHRTFSSEFYVRVRSKPIIEHSEGVRFAPYPAADSNMEELMTSSTLGLEDEIATKTFDQVQRMASSKESWCACFRIRQE
eukprot:gene8249-1518_t